MSKGGSDYTPGRTRTSKLSIGTGSVPTSEGSTRFGNTIDDNHEFTGSVSITGSFTVYGPISFTGSLSGAIESIASSTDNALVRWDGIDGEKVQDSNAILTDAGYLYVSGGLDVSGSTKFGYDSEQIHQFTGSVHLPIVYAQNTIINPQLIVTGTTNLSTTYINDDLYSYGSTVFGDTQEDIHQFTGSVNVTGNFDVTGSTGISEIYGTDADGSNAIGVRLGSSNTYSTAGSKLLSVLNNGTEKSYVDYTGQIGCCYSPNGGKTEFKYATENLTLVSGAGTTSSLMIPAGALVYAVAVYVTADFPISGATYPMASTFAVGTSTTTNVWGYGIPTTAGSTNATSSTMAGFTYFGTNSGVVIRPAIYNSDLETGSVRIEARYLSVTAPTS